MERNFRKLLMTVVIAVATAGLLAAQVTTSSIGGNIAEPGGAAAGVTVTAVHQPTGIQYRTASNEKGDYSIQNMRPGGPYTVKYSLIGFKTAEFSDIHLTLSGNTVLNLTLEQDVVDLQEVVVSGSRRSNMNTSNAGAVTGISARDIAAMPTISRSINDLTRLTPQASGQSIGGGNYRQNFITVDGAAFNNAFGIGQNLPGNGSPISIDALDQIAVSLTPYDVRQSGFIGAAVNAVTKSGSNEFKGSFYTYRTDERLRGNKVDDDYFNKSPSQYRLLGLTFGGPVIKNRLFFFVNYESEKTVDPGPSRVASADGAGNGTTIARPTESDMIMMSKYLRDSYGYETGAYQGYSFDSPGSKFLARLDWNISQNHKASVRYSSMSSKTPYDPSTSTSPISPTPFSGSRTGANAMWYKNSGYYQEQNFSSLSGELNSGFLDGKLQNTLRATWSYQDEPRSTGGNRDFPFVDILKDNQPYTSFGTEPFSFGNLRQVNTLNFTDEIKYSPGINNLTFGLSYEHNLTKNGFMRFGTGLYIFDSWDDFVNGSNPKNYAITFSNSPGYAQAFPSFKFDQYSLYLQDELRLSRRLNVTGGIRLDLPVYPEHPEGLQTHPMILDMDFNGRRYNTATMPATRLMLSPRLGFNYDVSGDRSLILRGGTGIFTGRIPFVWICSQSGDAGMLQQTMMYSGDGVPGKFDPDPKKYLPNPQPAAGTSIPTGGFTVMDPDFRMPSTWKSSIAADFELPGGFTATVEAIYNKDINPAVVYKDGLVEPVAMNIADYPDHRLMYLSGNAKYVHKLNRDGLPEPATTNNAGATPLFVTNFNENTGYYASLTFRLEKALWHGLSGMIAYTRSLAKSLHDGGGDQMYSLWNGYATVNGSNTPELGHASYVMPNNLIGSLSYRYGGFAVSLFYRGGNDQTNYLANSSTLVGRSSYYYSSNIVNDGAGNVNLIYVPKNPSEIQFVEKTVNGVTYSAQEQSDAFFKYIEQDPYLKTRKGKYAEKNALVFPWAHRFDMKFTQDFVVNIGKTKNTLQAGMDIANVGNLLNSGWGNRWQMNQNQLLIMTNAAQVTPTGNVVPTFQMNHIAGTGELPSKTFRKTVDYGSTFSIQFSLRYMFN
ncbi:MAG: TonB-dependent receptor [Prevotellaceae bacterium]|jgi:hypothetical protein|nr:TonB-dependent receptor [Prevotellaceae bacterium]